MEPSQTPGIGSNQQSQISMNSNLSNQSSEQLNLSAMDSMQSMGSSELVMPIQSVHQHPNQNFAVVHNKLTIMIDPISLSNSSPKFKELITPYVQKDQLSSVHLEIQDQEISDRSVNNFLRLCQNLPTDVQNSEMKEMCEIARMFQATQIYNTGLAFVQSSIDPNFNVPENKYESKQYLIIKENENSIFNSKGHDLDGLEFEDSNEKHNLKKAMSLTGIEFDDECDTGKANDNTNNNNNNNNVNQAHTNEDEVDGHLLNSPDSSKSQKPKFGSIIYQIKCENRPLKPTIYQFSSNGHVLFTAKHKENNIYIAEGTEVHINKDTDNHICHIRQSDDDYNLIHLRDQEFRLNYVKSGKPNLYSIDVTFINQDQKISWSPKPPKYDAMSNKYYLNFHGEYKRNAIRSKANIVLQNTQGKRTFIVRKMELYLYEVECLPIVNPIIAFSIALSDIVGPYMDPFADIDISLPNK